MHFKLGAVNASSTGSADVDATITNEHQAWFLELGGQSVQAPITRKRTLGEIMASIENRPRVGSRGQPKG